MKTPDDNLLPDWLVERYARGELDAEQTARLTARLQGADAPRVKELLHARVEALRVRDQEILAQHPPAEAAREIRRRLALAAAAASVAERRSGRAFWALGALATSGVALAALLLLLRPGGPPEGAGAAMMPLPGEPGELTTIKGLRPQLAIYRKRSQRAPTSAEGSADRLAPGTVVRPGDTLQLSYVSGGKPFGVVASVDGKGAVTLHLPEAEGGAAQLAARGETLLPHAYQLDATPGFERFVLVTSDQPFSTATVREALRPGGPSLPANLSATEHTLSKETP